jgi:hypothetical protein
MEKEVLRRAHECGKCTMKFLEQKQLRHAFKDRGKRKWAVPTVHLQREKETVRK